MDRKLYRCKHQNTLAGVCAGFGNYWRLDPNLIRLAVIFLALATAIFPFAILYLVFWAVIPEEESSTIHFDSHRIYRSSRNKKIAGVCDGLAEFMNWSTTAVRLWTAIIAVLTGIVPLATAYLVAWLIIPQK
ncbi:MAG: PspC domain-containing protein [Myxococcota bacterium]